MEAIEILVIIGCVLIVGGVIVSSIIKRKKGISCDCCSGHCENCHKKHNENKN